MMKYLNKFYEIIDKIGKRNFMLFIFVLFVFVVSSLYVTFSIYTSTEGISVIDNITTYKFILNADQDTNMVSIAAGSSKNVAITVTNSEKLDLKYGIYYESVDVLTDVVVYYNEDSEYLPNGVIESNKDYIVDIKIENNSESDVSIEFGILFGFENGGDLVLGSGQNWVENFDEVPQV